MKLTAGALALATIGLQADAWAGDKKKTDLAVAQEELSEARIVDVAIDLFAPGVSDTPPSPMLQKGIRSSVRKSEARYIPIHLRNTLQSTGQWGEVRVVPGGASWAELLVSGRIEKSNGKDLELELRATDANGRVWLKRIVRPERRHHRLRKRPSGRRARPVPGALQQDRERPGEGARPPFAEGAAGGARGGDAALRRRDVARSVRGLPRDRRQGPGESRAPARGGRPDDPARERDPRARPHVRRHAQRVLQRLLRAHGPPLRRLARLQLRGAEGARRDQPQARC